MTQMENMDRQLQRLTSKLEQLTELWKESVARTARRSVVTVSDIARMKGISPAHLRKVEPYLMPDFGRSQYPDGPARWDIGKFLEWDSRPLEARRRAWIEGIKKASI